MRALPPLLALSLTTPLLAQPPATVLLPDDPPVTLRAGGPGAEHRLPGAFGNVELQVDVRLESDAAAAGILLGGRYPVNLGVGPAGVWQRLVARFRHEHGEPAVLTARIGDTELCRDLVLPEPEGGASADLPFERLPGLRHAYDRAATPDWSHGGFAVAVRFRARGDGTLVAKAPPRGKWAPHGKTLFVRGGRLVYDIGWVGAVTGRTRVADGAWHTAVLTHDDSTAQLWLDGAREAQREGFVAEDEPGHVLKIGATSPNFGGGLEDGEIEAVHVYARPLGATDAARASRGEAVDAPTSVVWDQSVASNVPADETGQPVRGPFVLRALRGAVSFRGAVVRPLAEIDHARLIRAWDDAARRRGEALFNSMCAACHGVDGETVLNPQARAFSKAPFENGSDPYALFQTLTRGFRTMPPQTWMTPAQRYEVIHYLREAFLQEKNPQQYVPVTDAYLATLPPPLPQPAAADDLPERDYGPALVSQLGRAVPAGMTVRLPHGLSIGYDLHRMASVGAWRGAFVELEETQHYQQRGEGIAEPGARPLRWTRHWGFELDDAGKPPRGPVPAPELVRHGHHVHRIPGREAELVLDYTVRGRRVLEAPTAVRVGEQTALVHRLRVAAGDQPIALRWTRDGLEVEADGGAAWAQDSGEGWVAVSVHGDRSGIDWDGPLVRFSPSEVDCKVTVVRGAADSETELDAFRAWARRSADDLHVDPDRWTRPGAPLWPDVLHTRGELGGVEGGVEGAYVVDTLTLPATNPWNAWLRTSALGCFADRDRIAVCTLGGDVWLVDGVTGDLQDLRWKRFAAGMFEPLGLEVVDGTVYVTCRDGVLRLHDLNGDDEADFYECFYADTDVTASFHAFNFDLQRDGNGNLHFVKSGRYTDFTIPGAVVRIPPEGGTGEYIATGFRTPNGMGILPDGLLLVSDNQGNWVPASKVSLVRDGGFYGVFKTGKREREDFDVPVLWLPQDVDSSSGGQLWLGDERFGPYAGHLLHTSFGKGFAYVLDLHQVGGLTQASCVTLPFQFDAGVQRARIHPRDGQVYLTGLSGWQGPRGGADGCLQRLRYTGRAETRLLSARATADGVALRFTAPLAPNAARDIAAAVEVEQWNYRWTAAYGSDHWSVARPEEKGHDRLTPTAARLTDDGSTLHVSVPGLAPAHQWRVRCDLPAADGARVRDTVHLTVHRRPGA